MDIIYHNRKPVDQETENRLSASYASLGKLLQQSDAISIHTPLNDETYHLVNKQTFDQMKTGTYLINTSRGEVMDEKALVHALKAGKIQAAGLDVYEFEPEISHELMGMSNVVLLPHIGSATKETRSRMSELVAKNVIAALEGTVPDNLIP